MQTYYTLVFILYSNLMKKSGLAGGF